MTDIQSKNNVLSAFMRQAQNGVRIWNVFDVMYETDLPYPALKELLDSLEKSGDVVCRDVKTYEYTGAVERGDVTPSEKDFADGKREIFSRYLEEFKSDNCDLFNLTDCGDGDDDDDDDENDMDTYVIRGVEQCAAACREFLDKNGIEFDEQLTNVLSLAISAAERFGSPYIGTEHILYAMLLTDSPAKTSLGFTADRQLEYTAEFLSELCSMKKAGGFTENASEAISEAVQYAKEINGECACAGAEHLLFKILSDSECSAVKILSRMQVAFAEIYKRLAKAVNS